MHKCLGLHSAVCLHITWCASYTTEYLDIKINLALIILQSTQKFKNFQLLVCFGKLSCLLIKIKYDGVPETFLESSVFDEQCTLGTRTNWTLDLTQAKSYCFRYRNLLLWETEPGNDKLHSYWNHSVSLMPTMTVEKHCHRSFHA